MSDPPPNPLLVALSLAAGCAVVAVWRVWRFLQDPWWRP